MPSVTRLARDVAAKIWPVVTARSQQGWQWLTAPRDPITWTSLRAKLTTLPLLPSTYAGRFGVPLVIVVLLLLVLPWYAKGHKAKDGAVTYPNAAIVNPIIAGIGAALAIYAALRQAQTASSRHAAQTDADRQRRITESFSKAIEQLGNEKLEVRLGGIYALERISNESPQDYWTVMENLTAFVRERTQRTEAERTAKPIDQRVAERAYSLWEENGRHEGRSEEFWATAVKDEMLGEPPATDIAVVLTVITRRSEQHRALETLNDWHLDFQQAFLRRAILIGAHLEGARLSGAHLESANLAISRLEDAKLDGARLEGAILLGAHLEGARLSEAHLESANLAMSRLDRANLAMAHLERANLGVAHLERAHLAMAHLEGAHLAGAYLQGADLRAEGITQAQIDEARGDTETKLPEGLTRPAHWTQPEGGAESAA